MSIIPSLKFTPPKRSNFDLSHVWRGSISPGTANVTLLERCVPGDTFTYKVRTLVKTMPLRGPLLGRYAISTRLFFIPSRLYVPSMRTNQPTPTSVGDFTFPVFRMSGYNSYNMGEVVDGEDGMYISKKSVDFYTVDPTSLLSQLGLPGGFIDTTAPRGSSVPYPLGNRRFNAIPLLAYWDIMRNYYMNPQEDKFYMHIAWWTPGNTPTGNSVLTRIDSFSQQDLNNFYRDNTFSGQFWELNGANIAPFNKILGYVDGSAVRRVGYSNNRMLGLCCTTYRPDQYTQFLSKSAYDGIRTQGGVVNTQSGSFSIDQFRLANKLTKLAERAGIVGGRFGEFIRATFGVDTSRNLDIPEYLGGTTQYLDFQDVVNQSGPTGQQSNDPEIALGALGGRGISYDGSGSFKINCTEYGYIMGITTLVPIPDYHQGVSPYLNDLYFSDMFNPMVDRIGFEPIPLDEVYGLPLREVQAQSSSISGDLITDDPHNLSIAYRPAWMTYMTRNNEVHGDLSDTLKFWTVVRDFDSPYYYPNGNLSGSRTDTFPTANDLQFGSTVLPHGYSNPFVDDNITAQNFILQIAWDTFAKRPISKKLMPNIG